MIRATKGGSGPTRTPASEAERAAREARLAIEMRRNLEKRKRQARARHQHRPAEPGPAPQPADEDPDRR